MTGIFHQIEGFLKKKKQKLCPIVEYLKKNFELGRHNTLRTICVPTMPFILYKEKKSDEIGHKIDIIPLILDTKITLKLLIFIN